MNQNIQSQILGSEESPTQFYWQEMGLDHDPFDGTTIDIFYNPQWENYLELLQHLSSYCRAVKILVGDVAVGKTTFIKAFSLKAKKDLKIITLNANSGWEAEDFVNLVLSKLNLKFLLSTTHDKQVSIVNHLQRNEQKHLIVIDDAHKLSDEVLMALKQWNDIVPQDKPNLHFMLVGNNTLYMKLQELFSKEEVADFSRIFELRPLDMAQVDSYLTHCLSSAGFTGASIFKNQDIRKIHKETKGYIVDINQHAKVMLINKLMPNKLRDLPFLKKKTLTIVVTLLAMIMLFFFFKNDNKNLPQINEKNIDGVFSIESNNRDNIEVSILDTTKKDEEEHDNLILDETNDGQEEQGEQKTENSEQINSTIDNELLDEQTNGLEQPSQKELDEVNSIVQQQTKEEKAKKEEKSSLPNEPFLEEDAKKEDILATKKASTTETLPIKAKDTKNEEKENTLSMVEKKSIIEKASKPQPAKLARNDNNYLIQLVAMKDVATLQHFVNKHKLAKGATYFKTTNRDNTKLIALGVGDYKTKKEAKLALKQLPQELQKLGPWVRKTKDIKSSIL